MGKTSFGLGLHVVHIVRSQEMVMKQLKTLPYITRLLIRIGIGPGFCSGKILARFSHTFTFSIICKRYYIFQILRVTSSTRINNCVTGNQLPIKCHIIIRRVITLIFWKQFFSDYVLEGLPWIPQNLHRYTYSLQSLGPILFVDFRCRLWVVMQFLVSCCLASSYMDMRFI